MSRKIAEDFNHIDDMDPHLVLDPGAAILSTNYNCLLSNINQAFQFLKSIMMILAI
ncbi:uncharacterized protein ASCRUDRAFT_76031 [Ascoidea rubescens DSM 1968]|uniref:Uncharacterized protein n=1 Tax=Ascoidea rubescens DSM 1968 TaxID=1344418 RepID=A0A1D2VGM0_9ASCO|nr:hypothetical protein ASCRUDRAFT_76031 [Ascoidea rubescens DSM 1968]ODV60643.1 hypothetical protein ASCRUDRAFT_76031 [Ascoidea rubescens DSM 1968]